MKKFIFFAAIFVSGRLFALDRFVDPTLSNGNGTTLFTNITSAVGAAVNGDRIVIVPGTYNEPALTLGKSLTLLSQTAGTTINFNGNITIAGFQGMKLEILGFDLGIYSISSNAISGGSASNRAKVSIINSKMTNLSVDADYYELNCTRSTMASTTTFRYGNFVVSRTNLLYVNDEPSQNLSGAKILITADTIDTRLEFRHDNYPMVIANCILPSLYFWKWSYINTVVNFIRNNKINDGSQIFIPYDSGVPGYNFEISSNLFGLNISFNSFNNCAPYNWGCYNGSENQGWMGFNSNTSGFPNPDISGFFRWTYNGIDLPCTIPVAPQPLVLTKIIGTTGTTVDAGNPNHDYYDIDLTINDRGLSGGPYSISNYNPSINPSNGKAFIFDLEMPTDIYTGQQVNIKAKGYHKN